MIACVAVQQHLRLFRDGLSRLLSHEDDIEVVGAVRTADELVALCLQRAPEVVVLDAVVAEWHIAHVATVLHRSRPTLRIIGLTAWAPKPGEVARARRCGISTLISRTDGVSEVLSAIRNPNRQLNQVHPSVAPTTGKALAPASTPLTEREVMVLNLVGEGMTSREISSQLEISHKTVENHKQRIFRKLGVQNQAHAVSVAMRAGQLRPARFVDLASGD